MKAPVSEQLRILLVDDNEDASMSMAELPINNPPVNGGVTIV